MTTLSRHLERVDRLGDRRSGRGCARVVVRWRALRSGLSALPGSAGAAEGMVEVRCVVEMSDDGHWRGAIEIDGVDAEMLPRCVGSDGRIERDAARGMWHVEAPSFLSATLRPVGTDAWEAVYVRSAAVSKLEMPGGRYEVVGASAGLMV